MDCNSQSQKSVTHKLRAQHSRRSWTVQEEQQLIVGLKDLVTRGLKCDNGFKTGYLTVLEQHLAAQCPGCDLKSDPHIASKIHVWKRNYGSLSTMLSRSGFGWNDTSHIIEVTDDQIWQEYIKTDTNARTMRHKSWPFYNDWCVIFGKDRATGATGSDCYDARQKILTPDQGKTPVSNSDCYVPYNSAFNFEFEDDIMSACGGESASSPPKSSKKKINKKRARESEEVDGKMVDHMSSLFERHTVQLEKLVDKMGCDETASMRKKVFDALDTMGNFSLVDKLKVATVLWEKKDYEIFFTTTETNRFQLVSMILDGSY